MREFNKSQSGFKTRLNPNYWFKMSSDGGDGDDTIYGYLPGSVDPYVSHFYLSWNSPNSSYDKHFNWNVTMLVNVKPETKWWCWWWWWRRTFQGRWFFLMREYILIVVVSVYLLKNFNCSNLGEVNKNADSFFS